MHHDLAHGGSDASSNKSLQTDSTIEHCHVSYAHFPKDDQVRILLSDIAMNFKDTISEKEIDEVVIHYHSFMTIPSIQLIGHIFDKYFYTLGDLCFSKPYVYLLHQYFKPSDINPFKPERFIIYLEDHVAILSKFSKLITELLQEKTPTLDGLNALDMLIKKGLGLPDVTFKDGFDISSYEAAAFQNASFHAVYMSLGEIIKNLKAMNVIDQSPSWMNSKPSSIENDAALKHKFYLHPPASVSSTQTNPQLSKPLPDSPIGTRPSRSHSDAVFEELKAIQVRKCQIGVGRYKS